MFMFMAIGYPFYLEQESMRVYDIYIFHSCFSFFQQNFFDDRHATFYYAVKESVPELLPSLLSISVFIVLGFFLFTLFYFIFFDFVR